MLHNIYPDFILFFNVLSTVKIVESFSISESLFRVICLFSISFLSAKLQRPEVGGDDQEGEARFSVARRAFPFIST